VGASGLRLAGAAGNALLLGQVATADTPDASHGVLMGAAMGLLVPEVPVLALKHLAGFDVMQVKIALPPMPWTAQGFEYYEFKAAAERQAKKAAP
jgi:hypothetical protein